VALYNVDNVDNNTSAGRATLGLGLGLGLGEQVIPDLAARSRSTLTQDGRQKTRMASLQSISCRTEKIIHSYNQSQTHRDATTKAAQQQNKSAIGIIEVSLPLLWDSLFNATLGYLLAFLLTLRSALPAAIRVATFWNSWAMPAVFWAMSAVFSK